jgi:hypothetical protein
MQDNASVLNNTGNILYPALAQGGGVYVGGWRYAGEIFPAYFYMQSGTISGNTTGIGGGVYVHRDGTFIMSGGILYGNDVSDETLRNTATFTPTSFSGSALFRDSSGIARYGDGSNILTSSGGTNNTITGKP